MELYQTVKTNWTEDYYGGDEDNLQQFYEPSSLSGSRLRRRVPFVPFAIANSTGQPLSFRTQTRVSSGDQLFGGVNRERIYSGDEEGPSPWKTIEPGDTVPFTFEERAKLRHMNSHDMKIHQV